MKVVDGVRDAAEHINHYGSHHSDSIITEDERARDYFMNRVDSACVYHNCSTRFSDGEEFGFRGGNRRRYGQISCPGANGFAGTYFLQVCY